MKRLQYALLRAITALDWSLRERLTPAGRLTLGAAFAAGISGIDTRQTLTYQVFTLLASALLVSSILALLLGVGRGVRLEARRRLPRYATAGQPLSYRVEVHNRGRWAIADVAMRERFVDPRPDYAEFIRTPESIDPRAARRNWFDRKGGYFRWRKLIERRLPRQAEASAFAVLPPGQRTEIRAQIVPRRRGTLALAGVEFVRADLLGLVHGRQRLPLPDKVVVLPRRYQLPRVLLPAQRMLQSGGHALSASVGDSEEFLSLREYRPGDSLRRIHWRSFARTGAPVVREFESEFFERHALALDTCAAFETEAFEEAVAVAASFVHTIDTQESLLDLVFVAGEPEHHVAGRGEADNAHLLEVLAGVRASGAIDSARGEKQFAQLSGELLSMRGSLSSAILVLLGWDAPRRALTAALRGSGLGVRVLLVCTQDALDVESRADAQHEGVVLLEPGRIEAGLSELSAMAALA